jgi:enoyl-CoA hydratase/carnithine racemase
VSEAVLRTEDHGRVRVLRFSREEVLNAFNDALYDAVGEALDAARADPEVACVVLTGTGRAFTAGQDLHELESPPRHTDGRPHGFVPFMDAVERFDKPLLAAVNGLAVGIGLTLLAHCDLVLVAEDARLRAPFVSLGVTTEAGSSLLLPARVGWQAAAELLYTACFIDAARAVEIGLAWRVCPSARLLEEALAVAGQIAAMPVASLVTTKRLLLAARADALRAARAREQVAFAALQGGPANREAIAAFRERRPPDFSGL